MEEYVDEAQYVLDDDLVESYDKEQALIDEFRDAGIEEGKNEIKNLLYNFIKRC